MKGMILEEQWLDNDSALDWDYAKRKQRMLSLKQLEERLRYWRDKQEATYLEMYRASTSI